MAKKRPLTDDDLIAKIDEKISEEDLPGYQLAQLLAQRDKILTRKSGAAKAQEAADELPPNPMADLYELAPRRRRKG